MEVNMFQSKLNIADAEFAKKVKEGQEAAAQGEVIHPAEDEEDMPDWLAGHTSGPALMPAIEASQAYDGGFSEGSAAESRSEQLSLEYPDLTSKTFRMKALLTQEEIDAKHAGPDFYDLMQGMHDDVDNMPEGDDKNNASAVYNTAHAMVSLARKNEDVRNFCADVFSGLKHHYDTKEEKATRAIDLKLLIELHAEQEKSQMLASLAKKHAERLASLKSKAVEKAKKADAKPPAMKKAKSTE